MDRRTMRHLRKQDLKGYVISVALVAAALVLTIAVSRFYDGKAPLVFFTVAVIVSAAQGLGPGLLTIGLSVTVILALFQQHVLVLVMSHSSLGLFAIVGVAAIVVINKLHQNNRALVQARRDLETANAQLSRSNEELRRFAYAVAHDLNLPVRNIGLLTERLLLQNADKFDDGSRECARLIRGSVQGIHSMIRGLLDYAVASGPRDLTPTDCNDVLRQVMEDFRAAIDASGAIVDVGPLPVIAAEEAHLRQVFSNLLGNALKYRRDAEPRIRVWAEDRNGEWLFAVADNGLGFEMQYAGEVFRMFRRLNKSGPHEGIGIGLTLCKAVVEGYGGKIWVESAPGIGSTFYFTLPAPAHTTPDNASHNIALQATGR